MWDGRKKDLEDQAMGPVQSDVEMNRPVADLIDWLNAHAGYLHAFTQAYPGEAIDAELISKAIASFERTIISNRSPFDAWVGGDHTAMTAQQVRGFAIFVDSNKGNCAVCHAGANFTDNGFHNIGLTSFGVDHPDLGRYAHKPVQSMKGAFKTPTLRDIAYTAPYFHDGSANTLEEVIDHYISGGLVKSNLSPNMKKLNLTDREKDDLVEFLKSLSSVQENFHLPILP